MNIVSLLPKFVNIFLSIIPFSGLYKLGLNIFNIYLCFSYDITKRKRSDFLKKYTISVDPSAAKFYETLARRTGTTAEVLMASTLFRFAGEVSVSAILEKTNPGKTNKIL